MSIIVHEEAWDECSSFIEIAVLEKCVRLGNISRSD